MTTFKEHTTAYLTVRFMDKLGSLAVPTGVVYRIDCLTSKQEVRGWQSLAPAAALEIEITAQDNAVRVNTNAIEKRRVTVVASYGNSNTDKVADEFEYEVKNLKGLT